MENVVQLMPGKWVSESVLMTITGMKKKGRTAATVNSSMADLKANFAFAHGNGYRSKPDDGH
ncbi:hypothetical protein CKF43_09345 [Pantoea graminicola]|uniref:excisionase family protein n=1 Tax=Pantoea sp. ARC607 TaxID=2027922 RepID=UPI000DB3D7D0|nr:excisionase family protein [Pantoea sp. ARC607]PZL95122.1 hypothetical protein CKF43_09345 [Pantoea sp. ARC607]